MQIKTVGVVGAGTMGASIAVALLGGGYSVILKDVNDDLLAQGLKRIEKLIESRMKKGLSAEDAEKQKAALTMTINSAEFSPAQLIIEAASENIDIKKIVFQELEKHAAPSCILATNTSGLSITRIAAFTTTPHRVIGLHFFNPAHLMKLVEVIPGLDTSEETINVSMAFVRSLNKLPVRVEECASFLVNRLLGRYMNEALWCLQEGIADIEQIDKAVCDFVMPIGPFALRDMNGADIGLAVAKFNFQEYGERFRTAPILEAMVKNNILGQKTGAGFYVYDSETRKRGAANPKIHELIKELGTPAPRHSDFSAERLFLPMINEAFFVLQEKVCVAEDLDPALMAGLGMRKGPLTMASEMGLDNCLQNMEAMFEKHGERFRPAPLLKRFVWGGRSTVV